MPEGQEIPLPIPKSAPEFPPIRMMLTTGIKDPKVKYVTLVGLDDGEEGMDRFKAIDEEGNKIPLGQEKRLMAYNLLGLTPPADLTKRLSTREIIKKRKQKNGNRRLKK